RFSMRGGVISIVAMSPWVRVLCSRNSCTCSAISVANTPLFRDSCACAGVNHRHPKKKKNPIWIDFIALNNFPCKKHPIIGRWVKTFGEYTGMVKAFVQQKENKGVFG